MKNQDSRMLEWTKRVFEIQERYSGATAIAAMNVNLKIAMVCFMVESGLTPKTAPAWLDEQITAFEEEAKLLTPPPKLPLRRRGRRSPP